MTVAVAHLEPQGAQAEEGRRRLLGGDAGAAREGYRLLRGAAEAGDAGAAADVATLLAAGAEGEKDWRGALGWLGRAAALGLRSAQRQLRLLSPLDPPPVASRGDGWLTFAEQLDLAPWFRPPQRVPLCESPRVRLAPGFVEPAVCDWIRSRAEGRMRPAEMYHGQSKTAVIDPHRTCSDYQFDILNTDLIVLLVRERIALATRLPTPAMEPPRVFHYALGEHIKPHYDRCGDGVAGYGQSGYRGDRIVTFLLYLNEGYEGGDLDFPKVGYRCKGAKGDGIYFAHVGMDGAPDPSSLHAGLTVTRGEKWVMSQWIHDRPFMAPEPP